jgi:flagellum-specific ATP synthase
VSAPDAQALLDRRARRLSAALANLGDGVASVPPVREGRLVRMVGMRLEAEGLRVPVQSRCHIVADGGAGLEAEVVGFSEGRLLLMPLGETRGVMLGARVRPLDSSSPVAVDASLLGRVVGGSGEALDGRAPPAAGHHVSLRGERINPLERRPISEPLDVGVRVVNALLTLGKGQRVGLFAGSGVGKSTLLGMMTRHTAADVVVVALVGERGREVREFVEDILGRDGLARAVVVVTPADSPPLMRIHGAWRASAIAEYFRAQGLDVLLLMDSLTRVAQAQREIGLAVGEPPVTRGYPPSVFSLLPSLVERAGQLGRGSITAVYTVLVEGDDLADPVADAARAILDGHIVLSREMAEGGLFPAVDIEASVSRLMPRVTEPAQVTVVQKVRELFSTYQHHRDLISIGAYERGSDPRIDRAIAAIAPIQDLVRQSERERVDMARSLADLVDTARRIGIGGEA